MLQIDNLTSKPTPELSYLTKPEWSYLDTSTGFKVIVSVLSSCIVYVRVSGYVDLKSAERSVSLTLKSIEEAIPASGFYVQITDYSELEGASREAQKHFIESIRNRKRLLALIFVGLNTTMEIMVKLGKRINLFSFEGYIVKNYGAASILAVDLLKEKGLTLPSARGTVIKESTFCQRKAPCLFVISDPDWSVSQNEFSIRFEILNGNILHTVSKGKMQEKHVDDIIRLRETVHEKCNPEQCFDYIIGDVQELKRGSQKARMKYAASLSEWYTRYPFKKYILYGANSATRAGVFLSEPLVPFKVCVVNDLSQAMKLIAEEKSGIRLSDNIWPFKKKKNNRFTDSQVQEYVSELLQYLGGINWDVNGIKQNRVDSSHPFYAVFESVNLLKDEMDELLQERQRQEEEKIHLLAELQHVQKLETMGTLAGGIAHEFNNVLGGIIGYTEIAREDSPGNTAVHESLSQILKLSYRARDTVKQILFFSRKGKPEKRLLEPCQFLNEELKILRATIPSTIEIRKNFHECSFKISADKVQLQQVVLNLCNNAFHAMEQEGGVLEIGLSLVTLDLEDVKHHPDLVPNEYVKFTISDTGEGIALSNIGRIFDPYFTTKEVGKGTGLGLSVAQGIIRDHDGAITVKSEEGKGTIFNVLLPKSEGEFEFDPETEILPTGTEKILLVDDEEFMAFTTKKLLEKLGYEVTALTSSHETLELFKKDPQRYDLLITDLTMPYLTGDMLASEITAIRPDMPVILTTGYVEAVDREKVKQSGIKVFIPKPCKKQDLSKTIRQVLDGK